jgi:hypothetical protein
MQENNKKYIHIYIHKHKYKNTYIHTYMRIIRVCVYINKDNQIAFGNKI